MPQAKPLSAIALRRLRLAVALTVALVVVQALGLLHRVTHFEPWHDGAHGVVAPGNAFATPAPDALQLFAGHEEANDCELFDQSSHADLAFGTAMNDAFLRPRAVALRTHASSHIAAQAQGFLARAPPFAF